MCYYAFTHPCAFLKKKIEEKKVHVFVSFQRVLTSNANGEECASDQDLLARGYILQYSVILYTDSEDPDQTVYIFRLVWAFVVGIIMV